MVIAQTACRIKTNLTIAFFVFLLFSVVGAQSGKVYDNLSMNSTILGMERKYALYLPPDYETSERSYPVLYLLHGGGDDQTGWIQFGEVLHITDNAIEEGLATPMLIVMPDANTGHRGYSNDLSGQWRYEDFFIQEFMPFIEGKYRIKAEKRYRAIAGLSMGGNGTFIYALHHPSLFSSACPLSAGTGPSTLDDVRNRLQRYSVKESQDVTDEEIKVYFQRESVLFLVKTVPADSLKSVRWYIDCGDDDFLYKGNSLVHIELRDREIPHEFRVRDGSHSWTYWRESLPHVLKFVSDAFHQY